MSVIYFVWGVRFIRDGVMLFFQSYLFVEFFSPPPTFFDERNLWERETNIPSCEAVLGGYTCSSSK